MPTAKKRIPLTPEERKENLRAYKRKWRIAHAEEIKAYQAVWHIKHKERISEKNKLYRTTHKKELAIHNVEYRLNNRTSISEKRSARYRANPKKHIARAEAYRLAHPEKIAAYRLKNREKIKAVAALYLSENPDKFRSYTALRRAKKRKASVGDIKLIAGWEKKWRTRKFVRCYWCGTKNPGLKCHADHITPLAKGGAHCVENLCVSCAPCNQRKRAKALMEWNGDISAPVLF